MITIDKKDITSWSSKSKGNVFIVDEEYHRNAEFFLSNFPLLKTSVINYLSQNLENLQFKVSEDKKKAIYYKRLGATSLNKSLKSSLSNINDIKFEVEYKEGILFDSPQTGGFDFAIFDEKYNINNFRNFCFGRKSIHEGESLWINELKNRKKWFDIAKEMNLPNKDRTGEDLIITKSMPTIIGEIQFGNWALAYYDMLKVLHLDNLIDLDLLIYITATGNLNEYLSDGIVNFENTKQILHKYNNILKVPIWLIGIDII